MALGIKGRARVRNQDGWGSRKIFFGEVFEGSRFQVRKPQGHAERDRGGMGEGSSCSVDGR